jgi:murein DD-endopeptidase MepM/ murein hydrolase activator NlpD
VSLDPTIRTTAGPLDAAPATPKTGAAAAQPTSADGQKLARLAGEFESMLVTKMLREMRNSGSWKDEDEDKSGFGAETMFETLDAELAAHLAKAGGFGLQKTLAQSLGGLARGTTLPATLPAGLPVAFPVDGAGLKTGGSDESRRSDSSDGIPGIEADETVSPLAGRVTTSPFGWRQDPFTGATTYHRGVDLRAAYGETIGAAGAGTVVFAGEQGGYGQTVVVEHEDGVRTRYAHLSSLLTEAGAEVKAGDAIGRAGRSGRATGTHLHFEVTQNGRPMDPRSFDAAGLRATGHTLGGALKPERGSADWGAGVGPALPGVSDAE